MGEAAGSGRQQIRQEGMGARAHVGRARYENARDGPVHPDEGLDQRDDLERFAEARLVREEPAAAPVGLPQPTNAFLLMWLHHL